MSLHYEVFKMPTVAATVSTFSQSVNGELKKVIINRDTNNFTLDIDLTNQNGTKEVVIQALAVTADTSLPVRVGAVDSAGAAIAGSYVEQTLSGTVTVDISAATNGDDHTIVLVVESSRS